MKKWFLLSLIVLFFMFNFYLVWVNVSLPTRVGVNIGLLVVSAFVQLVLDTRDPFKLYLGILGLFIVRIGLMIGMGKGLYPIDVLISMVPWIILLEWSAIHAGKRKTSSHEPTALTAEDEDGQPQTFMDPPPPLDPAMIEKIHLQMHAGGVLYNIPADLKVPQELRDNPIVWGDASRLHGRIHPGLRGCVTQLAGNPKNIWGDASNIWGDVSGVWGDVSGLYGCANDIQDQTDDIFNAVFFGTELATHIVGEFVKERS